MQTPIFCNVETSNIKFKLSILSIYRYFGNSIGWKLFRYSNCSPRHRLVAQLSIPQKWWNLGGRPEIGWNRRNTWIYGSSRYQIWMLYTQILHRVDILLSTPGNNRKLLFRICLPHHSISRWDRSYHWYLCWLKSWGCWRWRRPMLTLGYIARGCCVDRWHCFWTLRGIVRRSRCWSRGTTPDQSLSCNYPRQKESWKKSIQLYCWHR